jgi:hypothetical protein
MANTDKPFGLKPFCHGNGNPWNGMFRIYYHSASDNTALYRGDLCQANGSNDEATGKYPSVTAHVAGQEDNVGVVIGFGDTPQLAANCANLNTGQYCPVSTAMYVAVVDDPDVWFEIQEDSVGGALTAAAVYGMSDVVVGSGNTTTGQSGMELDSSEVGDADATLQIMRLVDRVDNVLGNHAKWLVRINEHLYRNENVVA